MRIIVNGNYCTKCTGKALWHGGLPGLALRYPASSDGKGTCANCGAEIVLSVSHKIIEREVRV